MSIVVLFLFYLVLTFGCGPKLASANRRRGSQARLPCEASTAHAARTEQEAVRLEASSQKNLTNRTATFLSRLDSNTVIQLVPKDGSLNLADLAGSATLHVLHFYTRLSSLVVTVLLQQLQSYFDSYSFTFITLLASLV